MGNTMDTTIDDCYKRSSAYFDECKFSKTGREHLLYESLDVVAKIELSSQDRYDSCQKKSIPVFTTCIKKQTSVCSLSQTELYDTCLQQYRSETCKKQAELIHSACSEQ